MPESMTAIFTPLPVYPPAPAGLVVPVQVAREPASMAAPAFWRYLGRMGEIFSTSERLASALMDSASPRTATPRTALWVV
ncbi:Uncharacterised protein [Mycobacterium tuberculosis]|nr:Uncharacterised protein [Mycobacterium tuberculosis]